MKSMFLAYAKKNQLSLSFTAPLMVDKLIKPVKCCILERKNNPVELSKEVLL